MALQQTIPQPASPAVASYDYTDLAEGTGITQYNGVTTSGAYILTQNEPSSNTITTSGAAVTASAFALIQDHDYDVKFNLPQNIKGTAYVKLTVGAYQSGPQPTKQYSNLLIRKWDGTIETEIASASGAYFFSKGAANTESKETLTKIDIPDTTHFKAGETLRLTIQQYGGSDDANGAIFGYAHDPSNRNDGDVEPTILDADNKSLLFFNPFKLKI